MIVALDNLYMSNQHNSNNNHSAVFVYMYMFISVLYVGRLFPHIKSYHTEGHTGGSVVRADAPFTEAVSSLQWTIDSALWPFASCPSLSPISCPILQPFYQEWRHKSPKNICMYYTDVILLPCIWCERLCVRVCTGIYTAPPHGQLFVCLPHIRA